MQPDTKSNSTSIDTSMDTSMDQPSANVIHTQPSSPSPSADISPINKYLLVGVIGLSALVIILCMHRSIQPLCSYAATSETRRASKMPNQMKSQPSMRQVPTKDQLTFLNDLFFIYNKHNKQRSKAALNQNNDDP